MPPAARRLAVGPCTGACKATAELFLARGRRVGMYDVDAAALAEAAAATRPMAAASAVTPDWANRLVVSRLAR